MAITFWITVLRTILHYEIPPRITTPWIFAPQTIDPEYSPRQLPRRQLFPHKISLRVITSTCHPDNYPRIIFQENYPRAIALYETVSTHQFLPVKVLWSVSNWVVWSLKFTLATRV